MPGGKEPNIRPKTILAGRVLGREVRAFNNFGGTRGLGPMTGLAAFGPNINVRVRQRSAASTFFYLFVDSAFLTDRCGLQVARDPRFGRNSELPGEDPFLNGQVAVGYMQGMREKDPAGHPLAVAYLKHFVSAPHLPLGVFCFVCRTGRRCGL